MCKRLALLKELLFRPVYEIAYLIIALLGVFDTLIAHIPPIKKYWDGLGANYAVVKIIAWGIDHWQIILIAIIVVAVFEGAYQTKSQYAWTEPDIEILHSRRDAYLNGAFYWIAELEMKNLEETEITDSYATLQTASDIYWQEGWMKFPLVPSMLRQPDRIKWVESEYSNELCEITIPPKDSRHVYLAHTLGDFSYNLRSGALSPSWMICPVAHVIRIRIDGKFNGKSMKPLFFDGYMHYELKSVGVAIRDTQNGAEVGSLKGEVSVPSLIFGKGDWTKDEGIKKAIGIAGEEARARRKRWMVFTKKGFMKAFKKATRWKPRVSRVRGKGKASK